MAKTVEELKKQQAQQPEGQKDKKKGKDAPDEQAEESGGRRWVLIAAVALVVVALAGAAAYWFLLRGEAEEGAAAVEEVEEGLVVEVAQMTANLADDDLRYARVSFAVVLAEDVELGAVEGQFPLLQDAALDEIARMHTDELSSADGVADLRQRLTERAHDIYDDGEVVRVVLTELIIQ